MATSSEPVTFFMYGCAIAGKKTIATPTTKEPTAISVMPVMPAVARITATIIDINNVWWPVRKINFHGVKRAIIMLITIAKNIIIAISFPKLFCATETMASLFGTTPWIPKACWKMFAKSPSDDTTKLAPAPKITNPIMVLTVPLMHSVTGFFCAIRPIRAIKPTSTAGSESTSLIKKRKKSISPPAYSAPNSVNATDKRSLMAFLSIIFSRATILPATDCATNCSAISLVPT